MKRLVAAVTVGSLLGLGVLPDSTPAAHAATRVVTVQGFAYPAGLRPASSQCPGGTSDATYAERYLSGGGRGTHATGYTFTGTGVEAGVETYVAAPRSLGAVGFQTYHPAAQVNGAALDGQVFARFDPSGENFTDGYYLGVWDMNSTVGGWSRWTNVQNATMTWYFWDGASFSGVIDNARLSEFAQDFGTDGSGAWLGFMLGCDGRQFFMDDLQVTVGATTTIYDFEAVASRSYISSYPTHTSRRLQRDVTRIPLVHGQNHFLYGDSLGISDGHVWSGVSAGRTGYLRGTATLWAKPYGAGWRAVGRKGYDEDSYGEFEVRPERQTQYQVRTTPVSIHLFSASASRVLTVTVKRRARARVADSTVRRGQRISVVGKLFPGDRGVSVALQRRTGKGWRTIARGSSKARGRYVLRHRADQVGRWTLRVKVVPAKGVLGTTSPRVKVRVQPPPPPRRAPTPEPRPAPIQVVNPIPPVHTPSGGTRAPQPHEHRVGQRAAATGALPAVPTP